MPSTDFRLSPTLVLACDRLESAEEAYQHAAPVGGADLLYSLESWLLG